MGNIAVMGNMAGRAHRFTKRVWLLDTVAVWVSRRVRDAPQSSWLATALGPLRALFRGEMTSPDLLAVVDALKAEGLRFWIAGGWGIDLLAGRQTRLHDDLDVLLADYAADEPRALAALAPLGYRRVEVLDGLWMDPRTLLDDGAGRQIEVLGIDRPRLDGALGHPVSTKKQAQPVEDRMPELFTEGELDGHLVPCLSVQLQLLFHSGFDPRGVDGPDVALLRSLAGGPIEIGRPAAPEAGAN